MLLAGIFVQNIWFSRADYWR